MAETNTKIKKQELKRYYSKSIQEIESELDTSLNTGLTDAKVRARLEKFGPNQLREGKGRTVWDMLLEQFKDVLIIILLASATSSNTSETTADAKVIMINITLN